MRGFTTRALHVPKAKRDVHGALRTPVYDNAAFEFENSDEIAQVSLGRALGHVYSRSSNPTVEDLEQRLKNLTGALGVLALGSGMAAISTAILTLARAGDNVVTTDRLFGHTLSLFQKTLPSFGIEVRFVDVMDSLAVEHACDETTKLLFLETISNPQLQVADLEALSKVVHAKGIPLVVDTTMTPPYLLEAKRLGVDIEVLSSTKFISGGGTSVGGVLIDHGLFEWKSLPSLAPYYAKAGPMAFLYKARKEVFQNLGPSLSPHNAYLQSLGLETMALRIERSCQNAQELAHWLLSIPQVKCVNHPSLPDSPFYAIAKRQFRYAGSILTFELESKEASYRFMDALKLIRRATNIHDNKSLILSPYHVIYALNSHEERLKLEISPAMMRLSVGIEEIEDLKEDILQALC